MYMNIKIELSIRIFENINGTLYNWYINIQL